MLLDDELTVRASSLSNYPDCPRRWAARHLRGRLAMFGYSVRQIPNSVGAAIGSGTHAAAGHDLEHRITHDDLPPWSESEARGIEELETRISDEGVMWDTITEDLNGAQKQVIRLAKTYRDQVASRVKPLTVEKRLRARHAETDIILSGQQDMTIADPSTLRDIKTGKFRGANFAQYGAYSRLLRSHAHGVTHIFEDFVRRVALRNAQPPVLQVEYDIAACEAQADAILRRIRADVDTFEETGDPDSFLANPSSMLCTDRHCPAHSTSFCPLGRK